MPRARRQLSIRTVALAALFTIGIIWFAYLIWGIFQKEERARADVRDTKAQLASLVSREATLKGDLAALDTSRGKEAVIRDTLGVAREGEGVIIVVPAPPATTSTSTLTWWEEFLSWF
jgi:cell division protein FtsB